MDRVQRAVQALFRNSQVHLDFPNKELAPGSSGMTSSLVRIHPSVRHQGPRNLLLIGNQAKARLREGLHFHSQMDESA